MEAILKLLYALFGTSSNFLHHMATSWPMFYDKTKCESSAGVISPFPICTILQITSLTLAILTFKQYFVDIKEVECNMYE